MPEAGNRTALPSRQRALPPGLRRPGPGQASPAKERRAEPRRVPSPAAGLCSLWPRPLPAAPPREQQPRLPDAVLTAGAHEKAAAG